MINNTFEEIFFQICVWMILEYLFIFFFMFIGKMAAFELCLLDLDCSSVQFNFDVKSWILRVNKRPEDVGMGVISLNYNEKL